MNTICEWCSLVVSTNHGYVIEHRDKSRYGDICLGSNVFVGNLNTINFERVE